MPTQVTYETIQYDITSLSYQLIVWVICEY